MSINLLNEAYPTPRYFEANRVYCDEKFKRYTQSKIRCEEIVSFDCVLFKMNEIKSSKSHFGFGSRQIMAVIIRPQLEPASYLENEGFEFCGYDLVETATAISAITDCGAEFESIPYSLLTKFGLLPTYKDAVLTQLALVEECPDEPHAYCDIYEIWRKLE